MKAFNNLNNGFIILRDFKEDPNFYILEEDHDGYPEILYGLSDDDEILSWIESFMEENNLEKGITNNKKEMEIVKKYLKKIKKLKGQNND